MAGWCLAATCARVQGGEWHLFLLLFCFVFLSPAQRQSSKAGTSALNAKILDFFSDDLISDHTAAVGVSSLLSEDWDVDEDIGQGAVLGGFLFNVLVNGLASAIKRACRGASCRASGSSALHVKICCMLVTLSFSVQTEDFQRALDAPVAWA